MATFDDLRNAAKDLPGAWEATWMNGDPAFQVGKKSFINLIKGRLLMKLDKDHQEFLFEVRPEVFTPFTAGGMRWSWVDIDAIDAEEAAELTVEAWKQVVPKKVSRAWDASKPPSP